MKKMSYGNTFLKSISVVVLVSLVFAGCTSMRNMVGMGKKDSSNPVIRVALEKKIISLPLEQYLLGVISKEMPEQWPLESLKAQAVAARTYAMYRKEHPRDPKFDLSATTADQVFDKKHKYADSLIQAVQETKGEILTYHGEPFEAFFHSACGGASEKASHVWEGTYPPPLENSHEDSFCASAPHIDWTYTVSEETLKNILEDKGYKLPQDWNIGINQRDEWGRVQTLTIESTSEKKKKNKTSQTLNANTLREILGYSHLRSTLFDISEDDDGIVFTGKGSGHGVGLCQWGAKNQAESGKNYREILNFYYPDSEILPIDQKLIIKEPEKTPDVVPEDKVQETETDDTPKVKSKTRNGVEAIISNLPPSPL